MLSVIIPSYNEELMIEKTAGVISDILAAENIENELIFVDDGSKDDTWDEILYQAEIRPNVRGLHFSRNFGKESAIMAGLNKAEGDCCAVIDCDLQMPPEAMVKMYRLWEQGYEIIEGRKSSRGSESAGHAFAAHMFYSIISRACGFDMEDASDFKLLDRKAVNVLINMREKNGFFRAMTTWVGFQTTEVEFDVQEREAGVSKWSTKSLISYAIRNITSFSTAPMQIVTTLGVVMFVVSIIFSLIALVQKFAGVAADGFTTIIILQLFSASVTMISLGIIGYYIACIYDEIKGRPRFIISRECGNGLQPEPLIREYDNEEYSAEEYENLVSESGEHREDQEMMENPGVTTEENQQAETADEDAGTEEAGERMERAEPEVSEPMESAESEVTELMENAEPEAVDEPVESAEPEAVTEPIESAEAEAAEPMESIESEVSEPMKNVEAKEKAGEAIAKAESKEEAGKPVDFSEPAVEEEKADSDSDDIDEDDFEIITEVRKPKADSAAEVITGKTEKKPVAPAQTAKAEKKPVIPAEPVKVRDDFDDFEDVLKL